MLQRFTDSKSFYKRVAVVAVPIIIQNTISNFVSLLDNIMVGRVGTEQMSGVAIVNQLMFIFYLCVFGAMAGAGIFTAQFFGSGNHEGIRQTFRFKFLAGTVLGVGGIAVLYQFGTPLIRLYLESGSDPAAAALTLQYGLEYLHMMLWGLLPFALANAYASTLRDTGKTLVPMIASVTAVLVNLGLNWVLIFGHFGAPAMGAKGAALATVISRYVELAIVMLWTHLSPKSNPFIVGAYRSVYIPGSLLKRIIIKGLPLLVNECLFATGMAFLNQCYSVRGLNVVAAFNISTTIYNLASVMYLSLGNVAGIIMGQMMGANAGEKEIRSGLKRITTLSIGSCAIFGLFLLAVSGVFPQIYKTTGEIRALATQLICVSAVMMPLGAYIHVVYFAQRAGGKTLITFLFDSGFIWLCSVPLAFCLSRFTQISIVPLFAICQSVDVLKCIIGYIMIRGNSWIQNLAKQ